MKTTSIRRAQNFAAAAAAAATAWLTANTSTAIITGTKYYYD